MINRLQLELLKKHTGPFLFCFFILMFLLLMQFLILHVDKLVGKGLELSIIVELILNNLAYMVVLAVPMAVMVSCLIAFGRFSEWNELTAVQAAGINPFRLMKPLLLIAAILFAGLSYFSNEILPEANHKARSLFIDIRMQRPAFDLQPGIFYDGIDGYTFLVREIEAGTDTLYDITLFQERESNRKEAAIKAEKGWLESPDEVTLTLFLRNGTIVRHLESGQPGEPETVERSRFDLHRISFDLSELAFSRTNPEQRSRNDRTMSSRAMLAVIDTLRQEKEREFRNHMERSGSRFLSAEAGAVASTASGAARGPASATGGERGAAASAGGGSGLPVSAGAAALGGNQTNGSLSAGAAAPGGGEPAGAAATGAGTAEGQERVYRSEWIMLNELDDLDLQSRLVAQSVSAISSYRNDLENLVQHFRIRDMRIAQYMVEVHKKFSIPFACIIFVLLAAPIGMMTRKGNIGFAAIIGTVLLTIYFLAVIQGEKWADRLVISPFVGMWGINILMGAAGILLTLKVSSSFRLRGRGATRNEPDS